MDAIVISYRRGRRTQNTYQMVMQPQETKNKEEALKLIGKKVEWTTPSGKKLTGDVTRAHGAKGAIVARFEPGLPGQAIGTKAQIL